MSAPQETICRPPEDSVIVIVLIRDGTVDFRRSPPSAYSTTWSFLGFTMSQDLKWMFNTESVFKKTQQRMYFLSQFRKFNLPQELLVKFYSAIIQSGLCSPAHQHTGQAVRTAETITGANHRGTPSPISPINHCILLTEIFCTFSTYFYHAIYFLFMFLSKINNQTNRLTTSQILDTHTPSLTSMNPVSPV